MNNILPWRYFWAVQFLGLACLSGGEKFAITQAGFVCRITALVILEPGLIVLETAVEKTLWGSGLSLSEMYWIAVVLGIALNALLFSTALKLIATIHNKRRMNRLRE